jgi:uncharacterized membrane protein
VAEPVAFNLGIAWLMAGTAVGAFGLVYNLVLSYGQHLKQKATRLAILFGLMAAIALPIAGQPANHSGSAVWQRHRFGRVWAWLDVRDINTAYLPDQTPRYESSGWWWWRSRGVINEYTSGGGAIEGLEPIAEFPGFSFVLGDMHPHVLALPFAFLSLAVA